jgi:class 3 adenylate cyclase
MDSDHDCALTFGDRLRQARKAAGLTQEELAERAGAAPETVSALERGVNRTPHRDTILALTEALQLAPAERAALVAAARRPSVPLAFPIARIIPSAAPAAAELAPASAPNDTTPLPSAGVQTFLIADVRGYTHYTFEHGDEAAARLAMRFAELATEVVVAHGGQVIELRGDEALGVFASARAALQAAVALQARLGAETAVHPELPVRVGIGLDAGEAVPVEGGYRGLALNLAARLCALAEPGEVLASETVIGLAHRVKELSYLDRGLASLKGFAAPVRVLRVQARSEDADDVRRVAQGEVSKGEAGVTTHSPQPIPIGGYLGSLPAGPLVGREAEMARLRSALEAVEGGTGRLVLLAGEPGIGKTRLAQEVTLAACDGGFLVATGRCYEPKETVAYYPFLEALTTAYASAPASVRAELPRRWAEVARLLPDQPAGGAGAPGGIGERQWRG